ncbi:hypothetical protein RQX22_06755 [Sphingosinicella sp. GR2756]|uniref:Ig-like domain-containing protein n=1 Tax=Sphingosinicella rhizophila TaxID=3050082 RepID=A0ABU3Q5E8_9SPHN|nr:hypothetical protein [Sphingosinicella sp. GR2756]MDT9598644.1 hypothetical protein [Sphingosinicella sp. GR2756]
MTAKPADTPTATPIVDQHQSFTCTPQRVWDGDGPIWCAEGPKVRLAGIAAREMDGTCRAGHPCPPTSGFEARNVLANALLGDPSRGSIADAPTGHLVLKGDVPSLTCVSEGSGKGSRTAAWCRSPAVGDLSCFMVRQKMAAKWDRYWRRHSC